jgi:4-amino-4-deoxy-L-arabinose transferase-like glycosyltransferase
VGLLGRALAVRERGWIVCLLLGCALLDVYRLGAPALFDQDESEYGEIAVEMGDRGDPVTLHVNGQPWFVHPPLYMWLVAATGRVAGFSEFNIRIWSVVASLLAVYVTVLLGRDLFNPRVGLLAGTILALTLQYLFQSRLAVFDTVLIAWMLLAFRAFLNGYRSGRRGDYLQFFLFAGLATATKGPIGLVLPGLVIAAFVLVRRTWQWRTQVPWAEGVALYAAVGLSWYIAETVRHGWAFIATNVGAYTLGRFFGVVEEHSAPWYFYVPVALLGAFPWTTFWPAAAVMHVRRWRDHEGSLFVLLWVIVPILFYSAAQTKLPGYIMPIFPFASIGVAALWDAALSRRRDRRIVAASVWLLLLVGALFWATVGFLGTRYPGPFREAGPVLLGPAAALVVGTVVVLLLAIRGAQAGALAALCLTMAVTWFALLTWVTPLVEAEKPIRPLAAAIDAALTPTDRIVAYRMGTATSLLFYTHHPIVWVETEDALRAAVCAPGRVFLVATRGELARTRWTPPHLVLIAERAGTLALLKFPSVRCELPNSGKWPVGTGRAAGQTVSAVSPALAAAAGRRRAGSPSA